MKDYYAKRAMEYEQIYQKPERQHDLKQLKSQIQNGMEKHHVLEIACGTGYWTQFAARSANSITGVDVNEEVLQIAQKKDYGTCPVTFHTADAYKLNRLDGLFSAALVCFWWSHIPKVMLDHFINGLHQKLAKGATVLLVDNLYVEGSNTPINREDNDGNTYQVRSLQDGSTYEVMKNFPNPRHLIKQIKPLSTRCEYTELEYFWILKYTI